MTRAKQLLRHAITTGNTELAALVILAASLETIDMEQQRAHARSEQPDLFARFMAVIEGQAAPELQTITAE